MTISNWGGLVEGLILQDPAVKKRVVVPPGTGPLTHQSKNRSWWMELVGNPLHVRLCTRDDQIYAGNRIGLYTYNNGVPKENWQETADKNDTEFRGVLCAQRMVYRFRDKRTTEQIPDPDQRHRFSGWYVGQPKPNRTFGVGRFSTIPHYSFPLLWRKPLKPNLILFPINASGPHMDFAYNSPFGEQYCEHDSAEPSFNGRIVLQWSALRKGPDLGTRKKRLLQFLHHECRGRLYLFSDYDTIFEEPEDELTYLLLCH